MGSGFNPRRTTKMPSTTPARTADEYARRITARTAAEGVGAFDRMIMAMEHGFSFIAQRIDAKADLRNRISGDWSDTSTRMRYGWFFHDVESGHLSIDQTLTVLDHWDRTWEREWRLREFHWHRPPPRLNKRDTMRMRMLLRWLRRFHADRWSLVVEAMATPAGVAPVSTLVAAE
jgi:hypothetical protein